MTKLIKIPVLLLGIALIMAAAMPIKALELNDIEAPEAAEDEEVEAAELELKEPRLLPDSRWHFLKSWGWTLRHWFTFGKVNEAKLNAKIASEKLLELRKLAEEQKEEAMKKAAQKYQEQLDKLKERVDKIKDTASTSPAVDKFMEKYSHQAVLHQSILDKLAEQVPTSTLEHIIEAREAHLSRYLEIMQKLEERTNIQNRLEQTIQKMKGSQFKEFKALQTLKKLEEKAPDAIKEEIQQLRERITNELLEKIENMSEEMRQRLRNYIEEISGDQSQKMEILEDIRLRLNQPEAVLLLGQSKSAIMLRSREQKEKELGQECAIDMSNPLDCIGRLIIVEDEDGCPSSRCLTEETAPAPEQNTACIMLWDPVCGVNDKTYSNACFAQIAGVEIKNEGVCETIKRQPMLRVTPMGGGIEGIELEAETLK